ncbi:phosphatidylinositol-specific phospholipase C/glycerophosphodiester phosphodiesterase family protein [Pedobacter faecalis]|uniref:phosphatidylinositol-specific phospholipase C/glycerophosphodiester phosphodiesterase family protein n=1 Tax=Pedobacter faecalis TaxID=3041495 RepID=UPI002550D7A5|nr:phosphatidylinositol-specific phospholipase C/glycerophosphodiester phosphodiesterase family protein [Pedobacter sp. ELA7]
MNIKHIFGLSLLIAGLSISLVHAQKYTANKNAHSHNDYLQPRPFHLAYENRFASMEIDVFEVDGQLYVAHERNEIDTAGTIERLYINPLLDMIRANGGKPYKNGGGLQFMIDFKTPGTTALKVLEAKLKPYRKYFDVNHNPDAVRIVLSGATPAPERWGDYDPIFFFDGRLSTPYTAEQMKRVAFYSTAFQQFSKWDGVGPLADADREKLAAYVRNVHALGKPVRFWGNPDTPDCWRAFIEIGVDYLNTDSPVKMAEFLNKLFVN